MKKLPLDLPTSLALVIVICLLRISRGAEVDDGMSSLMKYASSRTALSKIVFEGRLVGIDEKAAPYRMMARFQVKTIFKGGFGASDQQPKTVWIASQMTSHQYDCLKELTKSTNYVVYLNGTYSRLWMSVNESDERDSKMAANVTSATATATTRQIEVFRQKIRKIYWVSAMPQKVHERRLKEVKKYSCSDCSREPEVALSYGNKTLNKTSTIVLTCKILGECRLVSLFYWFKDGHLLDDKEQNQSHIFINSGRYTSNLSIKRFTNQNHRGRYLCRVANVLGSKDSRGETLPRTRSTPTTKRMPTSQAGGAPWPGWVVCSTSKCNNRGKCFTNPSTDDFACFCQDGYKGMHCELDHKSDETIWSILDKSAGLNIFLVVGVFIIVLIFVALVVIICCFSRLKRDVHRIGRSQQDLNNQGSKGQGRDQIDLGLMPLDAKQDLPSSQQPHRKVNNKPTEVTKIVTVETNPDPKLSPSSPNKSKDFKATQPSPIFSTVRRNYRPLDDSGKPEKSAKTSPLFGRGAGHNYRHLSPKKSDKSSTFTHYVIGPPGFGVGDGQKSIRSTQSCEDQPLTAEVESRVDPKLEEELKGILKELGEYVNDNQRNSRASNPS